MFVNALFDVNNEQVRQDDTKDLENNEHTGQVWACFETEIKKPQKTMQHLALSQICQLRITHNHVLYTQLSSEKKP